MQDSYEDKTANVAAEAVTEVVTSAREDVTHLFEALAAEDIIPEAY